ncbi:S-layer family protein [Pseudanabaena sp. BC1403]|uniref:two-partner secretion domain-containing protein n=1 Tax=Pseudanabaena sp. BC1403 TaxID=2043171 RepID=UPI000CD9B04C|nr:S-layer family protein [Pseudanabaena sp. BC1403]
MSFSQRLLWCGSSFLFLGMLLPINVSAQSVTADGTLSTTVTSPDNLNFTITNGNQPNSGANLFHSFSQFSVPTGGSATFNLVSTPNITTIFSRVTGGSVSNIDGLIQTSNSSNPVSLFLLNPSGIIFSPNARLNIGGSFVGTTANSVIFSDGVKFSASDITANPLLTVNAPVGLILGTNAAPIEVQGTPAPNFFLRSPQLFKAQTIALVGGEISLTNASLSNPDGRVELWAVQNAEVKFTNATQLQLTSASTTADWGQITLSKSSLIDTSGLNGGAIVIRGRGLTLQNGSNISSDTGAGGQGQGINVKTTEFVDLLGATDALQYETPGLSTTVLGNGARAGDITVETESLRIANGSWLQSVNNGVYSFATNSFVTFNDSSTGNISILAKDVKLSGYNPFPNPFFGIPFFRPSSITTLITSGNRNIGGNISVQADRIQMLDGAHISTDLVGLNFPGVLQPSTTGSAGDISIRATQSLEIRGANPSSFTSAVTSSIQPFAEGNSGNVSISTGKLVLANGGTISSALVGNGVAGSINIQATEVSVSDPVIDSFSQTVSGITVAVGANAIGQGGNINIKSDLLNIFNGGQITSSTDGNGAAGSINLIVKNVDVQGISQSLINGRQLPSSINAISSTKSDAGSISINSNRLDVRNGAEISVSNTGGGDAGNLSIRASRVQLDYGGSLRSEVSAGDRGNISIDSDVLLLRHGSQINTNATGNATGGNININSAFIVAVLSENSDITANAVQGAGGKINITTQGLFGLKFRPQLTSESDITASSQFGLSGTVNISNLAFTPTAGLIELPSNIDDPSQRIVQGCRTYGNSRFVATGRGGLPDDPSNRRNSSHPWTDIRDPSAFRNPNALATTPQSENAKTPIVEATGWQLNAKGEVDIYAANNLARETTVNDCAGFLAIASKAF